MAEEERREKNKQLKIKKPGYTGYDDDEFADGKVGMKRSILAKYDEELEGPSETVSLVSIMFKPQPILSFEGFRLGYSAPAVKSTSTETSQGPAAVNKALLTIDYSSEPESILSISRRSFATENLEISDYLQEGDMGFKKPKASLDFFHKLKYQC